MPGDQEFNIIKRDLVDQIKNLDERQRQCAKEEGDKMDELRESVVELQKSSVKVDLKIEQFMSELKHRDEDTEAFRHEIKNKLIPLQFIIGTEDRPGYGERIRSIEKNIKQIYAVWIAIGLFAINAVRDWWIKVHGGQ